MADNEFTIQAGPKGFYQIWKKVVFEPQKFFQEMPAAGGFESPLLYLGICALIFLLLRLIVSETLASAAVSFFLVVLAYILGPGIVMLVAQSLFHGEGDYKATMRGCAYAGICLVLAWVLYVGSLAYIYCFYLFFMETE